MIFELMGSSSFDAPGSRLHLTLRRNFKTSSSFSSEVSVAASVSGDGKWNEAGSTWFRV